MQCVLVPKEFGRPRDADDALSRGSEPYLPVGGRLRALKIHPAPIPRATHPVRSILAARRPRSMFWLAHETPDVRALARRMHVITKALIQSPQEQRVVLYAVTECMHERVACVLPC